MEIKISDEIKKACPNMTFGCIRANVKVEDSSEELLKEIDDFSNELMKNMELADIAALPRIHDAREVYKKLGKVPSKYRVSSEALMRRILRKKGIYKINNVVEVNNLISLKTGFSVGSYDLKNIKLPIFLTVGKEGDHYQGIGKDLINIANLPVLTDDISGFGSPTSDSVRAMITDKTEEILMCIYSFSGSENIENYLNYAKELLEKYASASNISIEIFS